MSFCLLFEDFFALLHVVAWLFWLRSVGVILFVESRKKPKKRTEQDYITQFLHTTFRLDEAAMQFQMFVLVHVHLAYEQPSSAQQLCRYAK